MKAFAPDFLGIDHQGKALSYLDAGRWALEGIKREQRKESRHTVELANWLDGGGWLSDGYSFLFSWFSGAVQKFRFIDGCTHKSSMVSEELVHAMVLDGDEWHRCSKPYFSQKTRTDVAPMIENHGSDYDFEATNGRETVGLNRKSALQSVYPERYLA